MFFRYLGLIVIVSVGAIAFVLGELDDSPGLQGLGALAIAGGIFWHWLAFRMKDANKEERTPAVDQAITEKHRR
jgi:hypothetical protein